MEHDDLVAALYARALPRLLGYGRVLTGGTAAAEDLVQSAVVKVFARRRALADAAAAEAYVRAAMRTIHLDGLRRAERWRVVAPRFTRAQAEPETERVDGADAVAQALGGLAPRVRTAIALHYLDDLSVRDVAGAMGVKEGTVKGYLKTGRAALAPILGVAEADGDSDVVTVKEVRR